MSASDVLRERANDRVGADPHELRALAERLLRETLDVADTIFAWFPALTEVMTAEQIASIGTVMADARAYIAFREGEK